MSLIKLTQSGTDIYINPDHVAIVSPDTLINTTNVTLVNGMNAKVEGSAKEVAFRLGWEKPSCLTM